MYGAEEYFSDEINFEDMYMALCLKHRLDLTNLLVATCFGRKEEIFGEKYFLCLAVTNLIHAETVGKHQTRADIDWERDPLYRSGVYRRAYEIWDGYVHAYIYIYIYI